MLEQWWHRIYETVKQISHFSKDSLHKKDLVPDNAWVTKNHRLATKTTKKKQGIKMEYQAKNTLKRGTISKC